MYQHNRCFLSLEHNSPGVGGGAGRGEGVVDDAPEAVGEMESALGSKELIIVIVTSERKQQHRRIIHIVLLHGRTAGKELLQRLIRILFHT